MFGYEYPVNNKNKIVLACSICKRHRVVNAQAIRKKVAKCTMCARKENVYRGGYSKKLISFRKSLGLSQIDVAYILGIPILKYIEYEKNISEEFFNKYFKILKSNYLVSLKYRKCLKCDNIFPSKGERICEKCTQENSLYYI